MRALYSTPQRLLLASLTLVALLQLAGLSLFLQGFLLRRHTLSEMNECSPVAPPPSPPARDTSPRDRPPIPRSAQDTNPSCTLEPTHDRLVFLVVDALRSDFLLTPPGNTPSPYFHNVLSLPSELDAQHPEHSFLSHCIADAPTTTLQRIKALTTGTLPAFVDAGSNFAGERATEDSWLHQAKRAGKRIGLLGDNTWLSVFPRGNAGVAGGDAREDVAGGDAREGIAPPPHAPGSPPPAPSVWDPALLFPEDSFNVEDLDTVDSSVRRNLLRLLSHGDAPGDVPSDAPSGEGSAPPSPRSAPPWDILIAHTLGLDHAGHRFGAAHAETTRKLRETDALLRDVVARLDERTLLVVLGDHGMTDSGDHGGDSSPEISAGLWVYSKGAPLTDRAWAADKAALLPDERSESADEGSKSADEGSGSADEGRKSAETPRNASADSLRSSAETPRNASADSLRSSADASELDGRRSVAQIDLVPSLSLLLGLPVPFSNLGLVIPELFYRPSRALLPAKAIPKTSTWPLSRPPSPYESLAPRATLLHATALTAATLEEYVKTYTASPFGADLRPFLSELYFTLSLAQSAYRGTYAPNVADPRDRQAKAIALFGTYARRVREKTRAQWATFDDALIAKGIALLGLSVLAAGVLISAAAHPRPEFSPRVVLDRTAGSVQLAAIALPAVYVTTDLGAGNAMLLGALAAGVPVLTFAPKVLSSLDTASLLQVAPLAAHALLLASNSYTVFEDESLLFLATGLLALSLLRAFGSPVAAWRRRLLLSSALALVALRALSAIRACREEQAGRCASTFHLTPGSTLGLAAALVSVALALALPRGVRYHLSLSKSDQTYVPLYLSTLLPFLLVAAALYGVVDWFLLAGADPADAAVLTSIKNALAWLAYLLFAVNGALWCVVPACIAVNKTVQGEKTTYEYIGFANTLGATYSVFFLGGFGLLFLVSTGLAHTALALHLVSLALIAEIFDTERDIDYLQRAVTSQAAVETLMSSEAMPAAPPAGLTFAQVSLLAILGHLAFFATGHQATFASIHWSTAFIGFRTVVFPFAPALVIINTTAGFILTALAIPLFVFWKAKPTLNSPAFHLRFLLSSSLMLSAYFGALTFANAVCVAYLRRHLMVWKIFAPRFFLSGLVLIIVNATLIVASAGIGAGLTFKKANRTFGTIFVE